MGHGGATVRTLGDKHDVTVSLPASDARIADWSMMPATLTQLSLHRCSRRRRKIKQHHTVPLFRPRYSFSITLQGSDVSCSPCSA